MGADMCVCLFYRPISNTFKPDWKIGHDAINAFTHNQLQEVEHLGDDDKAIKTSLHDKLDNIKDAVTNGSRELTTLEFPPYLVYITGGMSWGESPSDIYNDINDLTTMGILNDIGYNDVPDYKAIVDVILEQTTVLPMLMSLNPDLDKLISKKLKGKKK